jgi:ATP-dependent protease ClpP protease subunit
MIIAIDDDIGYWGITEKLISAKLALLKEGEEIELVINSPGGSVYEGIGIFNAIRKAAETHPVHVRINGLAASMATYIAIAARTINPESKVSVSDNSIFLIHNPIQYVAGDYREMQKQADYLQRLASMFAATYSAVSKQEQKIIQAAMDIETIYIGQEILTAGFANNYEKTNPEETTPEDRDTLTINAKMAIEASHKKMIDAREPGDFEKAVALFQNSIDGAGLGAGSRAEKPEAAGTLPPVNENTTQKPEGVEPAGHGGKMTPEELKAKYPECYSAVMALGETAALAKEKERVAAHLKLGRQAGSLETAAKFIEAGKSVMSEEVQSEYLTFRMGKQAADARNQDNPGEMQTGGEGEEDDAKAMASFEAAYNGKNTAFGGK